VRFYKGAGNTGTHTGRLYAANGTLLATATFTNETASGWQVAYFPSAVTITPGTTYVVTYHAPNGRYSVTSGGLANEFASAPLRALASGASGGNGVYRYGAGGTLPSSSWNDTNYWVDVLFGAT
jgi:hypothetical protein